jgi:hypothetical protein
MIIPRAIGGWDGGMYGRDILGYVVGGTILAFLVIFVVRLLVFFGQEGKTQRRGAGRGVGGLWRGWAAECIARAWAWALEESLWCFFLAPAKGEGRGQGVVYRWDGMSVSVLVEEREHVRRRYVRGVGCLYIAQIAGKQHEGTSKQSPSQ